MINSRAALNTAILVLRQAGYDEEAEKFELIRNQQSVGELLGGAGPEGVDTLPELLDFFLG